MLEALVSSKIRRALLEYLLTHPGTRFYLRGLAKELDLAVSPLRRELKRFERSGILQASPEGNILFYTVNTRSPAFIELQHAGQSIQQRVGDAHAREVAQAEAVGPVEPVSRPAQPGASVEIPLRPQRRAILLHSDWRWAVGATLSVVLVATLLLGARRILSERWAKQLNALRPVEMRKSELTVVLPPHSSSGMMHGVRWRIVPGGSGGFSSPSASTEAY